MAIRKKGKSPAAKPKSEENGTADSTVTAEAIAPMATAKLTVSVKRRMADGSEVFLAPGVEVQCRADELDETQASVTERVHSWVDSLLEQYPDNDPMDEEDEEDEEGEDEAEDEDEEGEDEEDEEEIPTEAEIKKMKKADLQKLASDLEIELESSKVADIREELIEALHSEEEEDEDEEEDDEDEEDDDDEEELTEEDLKEMKLDQLQEMCDEYEIGHPTVKKNMKLAAKKNAYIEHIMESLAEEE